MVTSPDSVEDKRQALLDGILAQFAVRLLPGRKFKLNHRDDVSVHVLFSFSDTEPTEETKQEIRRWVEHQGWQFSRQTVKHLTIPDRLVEHIYLAPMSLVELERGYHATRRVSVPSIRTSGLCRSTPELQTTDRGDCERNIYICESLGTPADAGVRGSCTAHWWRDHLAKNNRFNDPDWVILEIDFRKVHGAGLYRDIWSESGIIVGGVDAIPPDAIPPRELS